MGQVPVLEVPGGKVMTKSAAMVLYLGGPSPSPRLAPASSSPAAGGLPALAVLLLPQIYGTDLRIYYPGRYTSDANGAEAVKAAAIAAMDREFAIIDRAIGSSQYMLGARYSALDPYLTMLAHWHPDVPGLLQGLQEHRPGGRKGEGAQGDQGDR